MSKKINRFVSLLIILVIMCNSNNINVLAYDYYNVNNDADLNYNSSDEGIGYRVTYRYNIPDYVVNPKVQKKLLSSYDKKNIKLPKLKEKGYTFLGWFLGDTKINCISKNNILCNGDVIVEARFSLNAVKNKAAVKPGVSGNIIIDTDGGIAKKSLSSNNLNLNKSIRLPKLKKRGYVFLGWFVDDKKVSKLDYHLDVCKPYNDGQTIVCKAKWTPLEITFKFNKNGSKQKGKIEPFVTYYDEVTKFPQCNLTKDNLKFSCWSTKKKGNGIKIPNTGFKVSKIGINPVKSIKLFANYSIEGDKAEDDISITFNMDGYAYNDVGNWYVVDKDIDILTGKITKIENVDEISYEMKNANGIMIKQGNIEKQENFEIKNFGLAIGYNELIINIEKKNGAVIQKSIGFINSNMDNQKRTDVDLSDTDDDELANYYECVFGTDIHKADTDGDGLTDFQEILLCGTDPTKTRSITKENVQDVNDDIKDNLTYYLENEDLNDGDLDIDNDGLTNKEEIENGTVPTLPDSDFDGLNDGDEVKKYHTLPLDETTDLDELLDGEEVELGFDPLNMDTDGNKIIDSEEVVYQEILDLLVNENQTEDLMLTIGIECKGYAKKCTTITNLNNIAMRTTNVAGIIGSPVEIAIDCDFESVNLTFGYDTLLLKETASDNLAIMWYDDENDRYEILDSTVDKAYNKISCTTNHFRATEEGVRKGTFLLVDKEKWIESICATPDYRSSTNGKYYDVLFVVDTSGSMAGDRIDKTKNAMLRMLGTISGKDRAGLVGFNIFANKKVEFTDDKNILQENINQLKAGSGTLPYEGLYAGIKMFEKTDNKNERMMIFICDGEDIKYDEYMEELILEAADNNIVIHCINVYEIDTDDTLSDGKVSEPEKMKKISSKTGGKYFEADTSEKISAAMETLREGIVQTVDITDSDEDGLYDVYEENGMKLSNGQFVYTLKGNKDSDGDKIGDFEEMGGDPVLEKFIIDGIEYSTEMFHPVTCDELSPQFVYVDGRVNKDGSVYTDGMEHDPASDKFVNQVYYNKYIEGVDKSHTEMKYDMFGKTKYFNGSAYIHNLYRDEWNELSDAERLNNIIKYEAVDTMTVACINELTKNTIYSRSLAMDVFLTYISGKGGEDSGLVYPHKRKTINVKSWIQNPIFNSAYNNYLSHLVTTKKAVMGCMNKYNREIYISTSPKKTPWAGSVYYSGDGVSGFDIKEVPGIICNIAAFGTFNSSDAGITAHCTYDPEKEEYTMEYKYYLIDFYDFSNYNLVQDQDAVGLAQSFELYGVLSGKITWKN